MSYIVGFGHAVPERVVSTAELAPLVGKTPEWIINVSGIEERRWAADETTVTDLCVQAAEKCLKSAGMTPKDLGMVLVSSGSAGRQFPGPACQVANRLGLTDTPSIDIPVASAGGLFAMSLANDLAPTRGPILVVAGEIMSRVAMRAPEEAGISVLFGDGAGACLIHPTEGTARILGSVLSSDGSFSEDLRLDFGAPLSMNGRSVILQASRKIPRAINQILDRCGVLAKEVQAFLMHQANQNLMDRVADALDVNRDMFFSNIRNYGNTSSASLLIAASEWNSQCGFKANYKVCFCAFGAGFHWGALLAEGL